MNGVGIFGELLAALGASLVSVFAKLLVTKLRDVPLFRPRRRLVTLTGGKTEYLSPSGSTDADFTDSLSRYLRFEELVRAALEDVLNEMVIARSYPDHADFAIKVGSRIILVEAKTHPDAVSARELVELLHAEGASRMLFVTPHPLTNNIASRFERLVQNGKIRLVHGESREILSAQIRSAIASFA